MLALLLALAPTIPSEEIVRTGDHFEVVCHFADPDAADRALEAVEATWKYAEQIYGLANGEEADPLMVHLYRNADEYAAAEQELTQGAFRKNLAFAHYETNSAHVAVQPPVIDAVLEQVSLSSQTLRLLAHEAAHLIRFSRFANFRSHPGWLGDGAASWIDEQVSRELKLFKKTEEDPNFSNYIVSVQQLIEREAMPTVEQVLNDETASLSFYQHYSVRWIVFRFLKETKHSAALVKTIAEARRFGGGAGFVKRVAETALQEIGAGKFKTIDAEFRKYVDALEPEWNEVYRTLYASEESWIQSAFSNTNAICWRRKDAGKKYSISGELTILPATSTQLNLFLGRSKKGFFSVAFSADQGIYLFEYLSATSDWRRRGSGKCEAVTTGKSFDFKVSVKGEKVSVKINGKEVLSGVAQQLSLTGPWGLSAQSGSTGIWKIRRAPGL